MSIVSLDLATETGVGLYLPKAEAPRLWTIKLRSDNFVSGDNSDIGRAMECLRSCLADIHQTDPITHLFFEAAILPRAKVDQFGKARMQTNPMTVYKLCACAGMAEWFAKRVGAVCRQVEQQRWRKHFCGRGTGKTAELKRLAMESARLRGWTVENDHEADAAGILDYALHCFNIDHPWRDKHLFGGRAA